MIIIYIILLLSLLLSREYTRLFYVCTRSRRRRRVRYTGTVIIKHVIWEKGENHPVGTIIFHDRPEITAYRYVGTYRHSVFTVRDAEDPFSSVSYLVRATRPA